MNYKSTRNKNDAGVSSAQAIKQGLAEDGGLFLPDEIPSLSKADVERLCGLSYPERAADILSAFLTDYTYDEILADCKEAYNANSFPGGAAPLINLDGNITALTISF